MIVAGAQLPTRLIGQRLLYGGAFDARLVESSPLRTQFNTPSAAAFDFLAGESAYFDRENVPA